MSWACEFLVDGRHDLSGLVPEESPEKMLLISFTLCEVVKHPCSSVLFGDPHFRVGGNIAHQLHAAQSNNTRDGDKEWVNLWPNPSERGGHCYRAAGKNQQVA